MVEVLRGLAFFQHGFGRQVAVLSVRPGPEPAFVVVQERPHAGEHDHGDSSGGEAVSVRGEDGGVGGGVRAEGREVGGREAVRRRVAGADGGVLGVDGGDPVRLDLVTAVVTPSPGRLRGL